MSAADRLAKLWPRRPKTLGRTVEIGWMLDTERATFIWDAPRKLSAAEAPVNRHAKAVTVCPAVIDHEARLVEIACPIDLNLRFSWSDKKEPILTNAAGDQSTIRPKHLGQMLSLVGRKEWRHPERPIVQILTPYLFVADEQVYMTQLPPFGHYRSPPWPGVLIGGRLPIHIWLRPMMWAFEWYDISQNIVLRRGEPWFYLRFETEDPSRPVRLVEAEMTPRLREYMAGSAAVTNFVSRTFSLFATARERRPAKLLVPKQR